MNRAKTLLNNEQTDELVKQAERSRMAMTLLAADANSPDSFHKNAFLALENGEIDSVAQSLGYRRGTIALAIAYTGRNQDTILQRASDAVAADEFDKGNESGWGRAMADLLLITSE